MLGSLSHLAQDEECTGNIRKRGILPVMADVATTMGQAAAMMPTPNGFLITACIPTDLIGIKQLSLIS